MLVVKVQGGLGNQMFQYALYKKFLKQGKNVKLDLDFFSKCKAHNGYELEKVFNLTPKIATKSEIKKLFYTGEDKISRLKLRLFGQKKTYYAEEEFKFLKNVLSENNRYLNGYWQSEKYFKDIREGLLKDFSFTEEENEITKQIKSHNSVSLHVRRGDYLSESCSAIHNVMANSLYYERAIEYISKNVSNPHFYIFSDDPKWVKENFKIENSTIIDFNTGENSYKDMYYMSLCKHNIIANSTFSWWGAWLNQNNNKIVLAPNKWFNTMSAPDIVCEDWIKIEV